MDEQPDSPRDTDPAHVFGRVADAYDRARPSYPVDAAKWLTGDAPARVLELGAGSGKLTEQLVGLGHQVVATDPSGYMLRKLIARAPAASVALTTAERLPVAARAVDRVVAGQAFHWFDVERTLPEIARVLRPGGMLALVWNERDERIPWVKRLGAVIGDQEQESDPTKAIEASDLFDQVETASFRFWQPLDQDSLRDLVRSRSNIAVLPEAEQAEVLAKVDELYDGYGRGADGMLLPYVTRCFRATVRPLPPAEGGSVTVGPDEVDTDSLLIDFH
jgi:SAM-dependent methyltransferase